TSDLNYVIEGLGSLFGGLTGSTQKSAAPDNMAEQFICAGTIVPFKGEFFGDFDFTVECGLITGNKENGLWRRATPVHIYPNPAGHKVKLKCERNVEVILELRNIVGEVVIARSFSGFETELDVRTLPPGIYLATLIGSGGMGTARFVK